MKLQSTALPCPECNGTGGFCEWLHSVTCETCKGTGEAPPEEARKEAVAVPERFRGDTDERGYWL